MTEELKLPGDKIAMIEEYLPGDNTFEDGHSIRSTSVGTIELNKSEQLVSIQKKKSISIPNIGDIIIGTVEASLGSMIAVSIEYVFCAGFSLCGRVESEILGGQGVLE